MSFPGSLASPHLPGPRHNSRDRASAVTARTAGRAEEEAMAARGGQEGDARIARLCAGGLARGREGRRRARAFCVPDGAGPAGWARCQRAVGRAASRSASEPCSLAAAPRPWMLAMLAATPRPAGGPARRGQREPARSRLPEEGLTPSRREKAAAREGWETGCPPQPRSPFSPPAPLAPACSLTAAVSSLCLCASTSWLFHSALSARAWLLPWLIKWPLEFP